MSELRRSLEFLREAEDRETRERVPFAFGTARLDRELPQVYDLNMLRVEHGEPAVDELVAETERIQGSAGLTYRRVQLPPGLDERLGAGFGELGWQRERLVVMALHRETERRVEPGVAAEEERGALPGAWAKGMRAEGLGEEVVRQLLAHKEVIADSIPTRYFAVRAGGEIASYCELYSLGAVAQVESVMTLPQHRGNGLASAVVLRAAEAAREAGAGLVFLVADRDDWPKELYRRLGFDELGPGHTRWLRPPG